MSTVAALAAALACWLFARTVPRLRDRNADHPSRPSRLRPALPIVAAALALVLLGPGAGLWLLLALVVGLTGRWLVQAARARQRADRTRAEVAEGCQVVASQLQVGQVPVRALAQAAEDCTVLAAASAAQQVGGDVPAALRASSRTPGADGLAALAAAWQLSQTSGAPIAPAAAQVARELVEEERLREVVSSELAAPRASGKLLALLPLAGLAMAVMVGANPGHFLGHTFAGRLCVLLAAALTCAGVVWTEKLADWAGRGQGVGG